MVSKRTAISVANAKREFSDLLGRVAYGGETFLITRRGRPMAKLVPVEERHPGQPALTNRGWLEKNDPFFEIIDELVSQRGRHKPRVLQSHRARRSRGGSRRG